MLGLFLLYLFRFRNTNRSENRRSSCVNRNRNSIPVLVYKPGQTESWFTLVFVGLPYAGRWWEPDNSSKIATITVCVEILLFCWSIDIFVSFLVFVRSLENNLLRARFRRSTTAATQSKTNSSLSCSASFSPLSSSEKDGCQHSGRFKFPAGIHEYTFGDWRGRTKKITRSTKTTSLSREPPVILTSFSYNFSPFLPFRFVFKPCAILLPWKLFLSDESRSFCTRLFLFRFINRNRNTAQKEHALCQTWTKRYLTTSQTRVKHVSQIHHRTILDPVV